MSKRWLPIVFFSYISKLKRVVSHCTAFTCSFAEPYFHDILSSYKSHMCIIIQFPHGRSEAKGIVQYSLLGSMMSVR